MTEDRPEQTTDRPLTVTRAAAERAAAAYRALADLAESVEDEWQYVTDLVDAYLPAIRALGEADASRAGEPRTAGAPLPEDRAAAVDEAIAEIGLITDPHRAIDWLSTFPHVVALALGGDVDAIATEASTRTADATASDGADDDDNPFAALLRRPGR